MSKKLTPEQAWTHVKALCPKAGCIKNVLGCEWVAMADGLAIFGGAARNIDWPDGMDRYPPEEEWRDAVWPDDWGKVARFRERTGDSWIECVLSGRMQDGRWVDDELVMWSHCQVRVTDGDKKEPELDHSAVVQPERYCEKAAEDIFPQKDEQPMPTAPKDRMVWLKMGGIWLIGAYNGKAWYSSKALKHNPIQRRSHTWDEHNQPTAWKEIK